MKTNTQIKAKGSTRVNSQQVNFVLKQRIILALNKLADRDTYQIGVEELEKTAECLTPEGISPFLSCILDTDSEQKSAVRKECIRLMGILATFHEGLVGSHLGKIVASIVKRLKDPDSVVRDACVETAGVLASKLGNFRAETDGVFVVLVKPLFEALGEQNKQVQFGSALCLAKIIDNTNDPPMSILQRMLARTIKLLKNSHFMAKSAVIELNRSIIQARGALAQNVLSAAMSSIQEALKSTDWTTRKAASLALGEIASSRGASLASFKASCICALESCRFDKVKPVRDTIQQTLQYWRSLPGYGTPTLSEAGSSIKENFSGGDCSDATFTSDSPWKNDAQKKDGSTVKRRVPLCLRNVHQNYVENHQTGQTNDWHIEIAIPKSHPISLADAHNEESEGSSTTKSLERTSVNAKRMQGLEYQHMQVDDKQEFLSAANLAADSFETKFVTVPQECYEKGSTMKPMRTNQRCMDEEISSEEITYSEKMRDRRSLDSTVTDISCQDLHGFCLQTANEMASIRKQLLEIEIKQSNLMDLLKASTTGTMDRLSVIQNKVSSLGSVVERIQEELLPGEAYCSKASMRLSKDPSVTSPRLSTCTPRLVEMRNRLPSLLSLEKTEMWEENSVGGSRSSTSSKRGTELWMNPRTKVARKPVGNNIKKSSQGMQNTGRVLSRKNVATFASGLGKTCRQNDLEARNSLWSRVTGFLCEGDLDSAYVEALCSGSEQTFIELLDRTGPVLESLSQKTISEVVFTLASYLLEHRFMNSVMPWLQQVADLSTIHGPNYLIPSGNAQREFLSAIQEALDMDFSNLVERRCVTQLVTKLQQIWGKCR